jgi:hypothetical protein
MGVEDPEGAQVGAQLEFDLGRNGLRRRPTVDRAKP